MQASVSKKHVLSMVICAVLIRALCFYAYIAPGKFYQQADSNDYHIAAMCMQGGYGMHMPNNGTNTPIFWRTPGYPLYLAPFYKYFGFSGLGFQDAATAQTASIWAQIICNGCIPLILFLLALALTQSLWIAYAVGWLSVIHIGLVLSSTYMLSEGIALIFFYLFLLFFYRTFCGLYQPCADKTGTKEIIFAALSLALYTWFRPMGQFVAVIGACILAVCSPKCTPFSCRPRESGDPYMKLKKIALFLSIFFACISPWYIRNYQLTGSAFFCPMFGAYLTSFSAPRIKSAAERIDLATSFKELRVTTELAHREIAPAYAAQNGLVWPKEFTCGLTAWPIITAHPWLALSDWLRESAKTAFDLYTSQLVACVKGCFFYDPMIEYITEKWQDCLYKTPMHWSMRLLVYLELIYMLLLWTGLFAGFWSFFVIPLYKRMRVPPFIQNQFGLWFKVLPMIIGVLLMTGGFGYARLRLPVEPLMMILSLTFWQRVWYKKDE